MARQIASGTVELDANGAGAVQLPSVPPWEQWEITRLVVSTSGGDPDEVPTAYVYEGTEAGAREVDATYNGSADTSDFAQPLTLAPGEFLTVVWGRGPQGQPGTAGEVAVAVLYGNRQRL